MRGKMLIAKDYSGRPLARRLWAVRGETVYILSDDGYRRMENDDPRVFAIGFPAQDCFEYDTEAVQGDSVNWPLLKPLDLAGEIDDGGKTARNGTDA